MDQEVATPEQQARQIFEQELLDIADFFPLTDNDHALIEYGYSIYRSRRLRGEGRQQITAVRCVKNSGMYHGTQTEEEELEAKSDPDAQFTSSWIDALQHASDDDENPNRMVDVVTQRWADDDDSKLVFVPPDSVARQQYVQFSPGVNFIVTLRDKLVKLPIEVLYPWDYRSRPLPPALQQQRTEWPFRQEVADYLKRMMVRISELFPITDEDRWLIDRAKLEIRKRFAYGFWQLAAAFVTEVPGHSKVGFQNDTKSGKANTDAEQSAIKKARHHFYGEPIKTIVTAHHSTKNHPHEEAGNGDNISLVMSCALCRKSLLRYSPHMNVIVPINGQGFGKIPMQVLYPLPDFPICQ